VSVPIGIELSDGHGVYESDKQTEDIMRGLIGYLQRHHWGLIATFIALGGTAYAVGGASSNIHACVDQNTGAVRIVRHCARSEQALIWSKTGPRGPVGPVGPSDGYYATGGGEVTVPPGNYIAQGGCAASQAKTASQSDTVPALGMARGILTDHPEDIPTGPISGGITYASVPNLGQTAWVPGTPKNGGASLANGAAFSLPNGGTIAESCGETRIGHGFGGSDEPLSFSNGFVTAIRVGTLHTQ
jgi:hypothetical protein